MASEDIELNGGATRGDSTEVSDSEPINIIQNDHKPSRQQDVSEKVQPIYVYETQSDLITL